MINIVLVGRENPNAEWGYFARFTNLNAAANAATDNSRPRLCSELTEHAVKERFGWQAAYPDGQFLIVDTDRQRLPWQRPPEEIEHPSPSKRRAA